MAEPDHGARDRDERLHQLGLVCGRAPSARWRRSRTARRPTAPARKAPTIPPRKRSGTKTVKCQTAMPIITQTMTLIGPSRASFGRGSLGLRLRLLLGLGARTRAVLVVTRGLGSPAASAPSPSPSPSAVGAAGAGAGRWRWRRPWAGRPSWERAPPALAPRFGALGSSGAGHAARPSPRRGRERRHQAAVLLEHDLAAAHVDRLALLPLHEHRRGDEDRGVGA